MPTYDYKCKEHGYFELQQRMADDAEGACPTCNEICPQVVKQLAKHGLDLEAMSRIGMPGAYEAGFERLNWLTLGSTTHSARGNSHPYTPTSERGL